MENLLVKEIFVKNVSLMEAWVQKHVTAVDMFLLPPVTAATCHCYKPVTATYRPAILKEGSFFETVTSRNESLLNLSLSTVLRKIVYWKLCGYIVH